MTLWEVATGRRLVEDEDEAKLPHPCTFVRFCDRNRHLLVAGGASGLHFWRVRMGDGGRSVAPPTTSPRRLLRVVAA